MVGLGRFELPTSPLSGVRSNQLSYRPSSKTRAADQRPKPSPSLLLLEPGPRGRGQLSKISRTQLNVHASYAGKDHRADIVEDQEKVWFRLSCPSRSWNRRYTATSYVSRQQPEGWPLAIREAKVCAVTFSLRKEVIQPQVLLRLPCYDFTPIMNHTLGGCSLAVSAPTSSATHFRDVTGGVYKARERIHGIVLICHY